jgi:hypothetical protein
VEPVEPITISHSRQVHGFPDYCEPRPGRKERMRKKQRQRQRKELYFRKSWAREEELQQLKNWK